MLEIKNLTKRFGSVTALDSANLTVAKGEIVVVMGPSGCGKSTLIRCVNRLTEPDSGTIYFNGQDVGALAGKDLQALRRSVGFVFQQFNLIARLTVLENVMFHLVLGGLSRAEAAARAEEALKKVGLSSTANRNPTQLSGGQQQRVGIARALVTDPQLMLWDEPTASLDPILVGEVLEVMEDLVKTTGATMVIVTHEVSFALRVADRVVFMAEGKIVEEGPPKVVFENPRSEIGRRYKRLLAG
ncbi:MAG TPA: amino acid ABC transporter ATP-binding protein [Firmicutes bacterium]|nr:amino acid ABC transporter ATP-binding protein [Bacillota bacterium]